MSESFAFAGQASRTGQLITAASVGTQGAPSWRRRLTQNQVDLACALLLMLVSFALRAATALPAPPPLGTQVEISLHVYVSWGRAGQ